MKIILLIYILAITHLANAQIKQPDKKLELLISRSNHGTGDIAGLSFATVYAERFRKRLSWALGVGGTIHDGSVPIFFNDAAGSPVDGTVRYTTAGAQAIGDLGFSFIRTKHHDFQFRLGALLRYQSSSYYDEITILYPAGSNFPFPVVLFANISPQRTLALGGSGQFQYNYCVTTKLLIGVVAGLQTDTNGDTITQLGLTVGRQF